MCGGVGGSTCWVVYICVRKGVVSADGIKFGIDDGSELSFFMDYLMVQVMGSLFDE